MHRTWSNRSLAFIWIVWLYVEKVGGNALSGLLEFWRPSSITFKHMFRSLLVAAPEFGTSQKRSNLLHGVLDPVATSYLYVLALLLFWSVQTVNGRFNKGLMHQIKLHCLKIPGNIPPSIITIHICTMWRTLNRWLLTGERGTEWCSFHIQLLWSRLSGIARGATCSLGSYSRLTLSLCFNCRDYFASIVSDGKHVMVHRLSRRNSQQIFRDQKFVASAFQSTHLRSDFLTRPGFPFEV